MARRRKNPIAHLAGFEELNEALRSVGDRATGKILRNAAEKGAEVIRDEAKRLAPKDTGALAEGIDVEVHRTQQGRAQFNIAPARKEWYGRLIELGTEKMAAQPFLRPALDAKADEAAKAVEDALFDALEAVLA
ncbi:MAG TPA: HK97-gp10 family putative phage morphogenesis protein [Longimicrobiales bacterium]